ncbi:MAG: ABC transporter substrate-binding protein [Bacteroidota bacterium]
MKRTYVFHLAMAVLLSITVSCVGTRNASGLAADSEAMALIRVGKKYMENQNYSQAVKVFRDASLRPTNQFTTMSIYLNGLANFYDGKWNQAMNILQDFEARFPKSKYLEDAQYHRAISQIQSDNYLLQEKGLDQLFDLSKSAKNTQIQALAESQAQSFLFYKMTPESLERYSQHVSNAFSQYVWEAQAYNLVKSERLVEAKNFYDSLKSSRRASSDFLDNLLDERRLERVQKNSVLKIALFLPFNVKYTSVNLLDEIPRQSRLALDFYEGFLTALENYEDSTGRKVFVKVFDTMEDTLSVDQYLMELNALNPQGIIGGYEREVVEKVSDWSEERQIPFFIPFSPYAYLVEEKQYSFLMSPSIKMHGRRIAEHAYQHLGLTKVAVWSNQQEISNQMAAGFQEAFEAQGGEVQLYLIDSVFAEGAEDEIPGYVLQMKKEFFDGVYIPINNDEESANLILSLISKEEMSLVALGSPRWRNYNYISKDLKENFNLHITTTNMYSMDSPEYQAFYQTYLKNYYYPPSDRSLQGYNMGRYYLSLYGDYLYDQPFPTYVKDAPFVPGIQTSFFFGGGQINQYVNIAKFADGILVKENKELTNSIQIPQLENNR